MIGYLAQHAFGRYDLPLPTGAPPDGDEPSLLVRGAERRRVRRSVDAAPRRPPLLPRAPRGGARGRAFGAVGARSRLVRLAIEFVSNYEIDPMAFEEEFGTIDPSDPASLEALPSSPERILGAMQSPRQAQPLEELQRLTSVMEGYADNVTERVGRRLVPTFDRIHEAMLRHRVERGEAERFIEGLLGLQARARALRAGQALLSTASSSGQGSKG